MLCGILEGRGVWDSVDTRLCMAELLPCSPETTTTLLIGYTLTPNKKFKGKKKRRKPLKSFWCIFPPFKKISDAVYILAIGL